MAAQEPLTPSHKATKGTKSTEAADAQHRTEYFVSTPRVETRKGGKLTSGTRVELEAGIDARWMS